MWWWWGGPVQDYKRQVTNYKRYSSFFPYLHIEDASPKLLHKAALSRARTGAGQCVPSQGQKEKAEPWVPAILGYWLIGRVWDFPSRARCRVVKHPAGVPSVPGSRPPSGKRMCVIAKSTLATKIPIAVAVTFAHWARFKWPLAPTGSQHPFDWTQFLLASDTIYQMLRCSWLIPRRTCCLWFP